MNYAESLAYLDKALTFGIKPGLERMARLLELLRHPEDNLRCIHIAGTNGKGSASSYCASILSAGGLKTGLFTSPYLTRLTERIRIIDGRAGLEALLADESAGEISHEAFAACLTEIAGAVRQMTAEGYEHPTEFELLTAVMFMHFTACRCDVAVLETGLGGRLDSTNVVKEPLACIITALGYDHMDRLGDSLAAIAREKAGIIKPGRPVYLYDPFALELPPGEAAAAADVIGRRCAELGSPLHKVGLRDVSTVNYSWNGQTFTDNERCMTLETSLLGLFQPMNAALALRACQDLGLADEAAIREGIRLTRWPARLEICRHDPPVLLDGSHNPQGCLALSAALARLLPCRPVVFLAGIFKDKDYEKMLRTVLGHPGYTAAALVLASPDSPRGLPAEELAAVARQVARQLPKRENCGYNVLNAIHTSESPAGAARLALRLAGERGIALCAFGSLHFAGNIRSILMNESGWPGQRTGAEHWTGWS